MNAKRRSRSPYKEPKTPELWARNDEMARARMFGATVRCIARHYGLSPSRVHSIVADVLVLSPRPKRPRKSRERPGRWLHFFRLKSQARDLRKRGYSYREIAERLGLSHGCVYNAARMVKIAELRGRAWLTHHQGRPKAWKRELLAGAAGSPPWDTGGTLPAKKPQLSTIAR